MKHYEYEISLYVEDELPLNKKEELLSHLFKCKKCNQILHDYSNIKNNIVQFYEKLPEKKSGINYTFLKRKKFRWNFNKAAFAISASIALVVILVYLFFLCHIRIKLRQPLKLILKKEQASIENNIKEFNKVIDKAIASKKKKSLSTELWNVGKDYNQEEFNKVINSILYSNYYYD